MKYYLSLLASLLVLLASCTDEKTTYRIDYQFDNTEYQSEFLYAYELNETNPGKWRSCPHIYDTVYIDGVMHELVHGHIDEVARQGTTEIKVSLESFRPYAGNWVLDTSFLLIPNEHNQINITSDMVWRNRYASDTIQN